MGKRIVLFRRQDHYQSSSFDSVEAAQKYLASLPVLSGPGASLPDAVIEVEVIREVMVSTSVSFSERGQA